MTRLGGIACAGVLALLAMTGWAQPAPNQQTTVCQFTDGGQVSLRYDSAPAHGTDLPTHMWSPGEAPMYLFTSTALKAGDTVIPPGAYSLYVSAEKQHWTLVVNKDVSSKKYDASQDLARLPMDRGTIEEPSKEVNIAFGHIAPKQCSRGCITGRSGHGRFSPSRRCPSLPNQVQFRPKHFEHKKALAEARAKFLRSF